MQADVEIIIPHDDLYIISLETDFDDFPTFSDSISKSDEHSADSDRQEAMNTYLDLRSSRQDENTDVAAIEQREHKMNEADFHSARLQSGTHSPEDEQTDE